MCIQRIITHLYGCEPRAHIIVGVRVCRRRSLALFRVHYTCTSSHIYIHTQRRRRTLCRKKKRTSSFTSFSLVRFSLLYIIHYIPYNSLVAIEFISFRVCSSLCNARVCTYIHFDRFSASTNTFLTYRANCFSRFKGACEVFSRKKLNGR